MARRYGGTHSPGQSGDTGAPPARAPNRAPERMAMRRNLLWLAPVPLVFTAFSGGAVAMATDLAALALLWGAAWLLGEGLRAEAAYDQRKVAKRPAVPRKLFATAATGLGVALAAVEAGGGVVAPALFGVVAAALHAVAFGTDPIRDKGAEGVDEVQSGRVSRAVDEGERLLAEMRAAISQSGDRKLVARVERFQDTARALFRSVEEDPRDLAGARRYLGVYLLGARDATARFAEIYGRTGDPAARADYVALLDDLDETFAERTRTLIAETRTDLDVEIGVLRDRLAREGVPASAARGDGQSEKERN